MDHSAPLPFLRETLLFLTLAGILIPLLQRLRINQVPGFLAIGMLLGPHGVVRWSAELPWLETFAFRRVQAVQSLAELGVIFLMFLIGLDLSFGKMWAIRGWVFAGGSAQVLLSALVIGSIALAFGNGAEVSLVLGLVLSLSSTAVVVQLLSQQRVLASPMGRATFAVLMLQDLAVVPLLILVDLLAADSGAGLGWLAGLTMMKSVAAVALILLVGRRAVGPLFRVMAREREPGTFMALTLLAALGTAGFTAQAGLSLALGAFLAGLLVAETEYRHAVKVTVEPFKGLLMGLFFMSVGMGIDPTEVTSPRFWVFASVAGLVMIKAAIVAAVFRAGGLSWGRALEGGLLLAQGGEFAFVIVNRAVAARLLDDSVAQFMLLVVSLSLMATPLVARVGQRLARWLDADAAPTTTDEAGTVVGQVEGHAVIAGFGRFGQSLAAVLGRHRVPWVAIEHDAPTVARQRAAGVPVVFGDAARSELLDKLHVDRASALLVAIDDPAAARRAVLAARALAPGLPIYVRSRDERHARELRAAGATAVVLETLEASLQLSSLALGAAAVPDAEIAESLRSERAARDLAGATRNGA